MRQAILITVLASLADVGCEIAPIAAEDVGAVELEEKQLSAPPVLACLGGEVCRYTCYAIAGMGCAAVVAACTGATTLTVGSVAVPCYWAGVVACSATVPATRVCDQACPE